jgi:hypothetical protein
VLDDRRAWVVGVVVLALLVYRLAVIGHLVAHWWSSWQPELTVLPVPVMQRFAEGLTRALAAKPGSGLS